MMRFLIKVAHFVTEQRDDNVQKKKRSNIGNTMIIENTVSIYRVV